MGATAARGRGTSPAPVRSPVGSLLLRSWSRPTSCPLHCPGTPALGHQRALVDTRPTGHRKDGTTYTSAGRGPNERLETAICKAGHNGCTCSETRVSSVNTRARRSQPVSSCDRCADLSSSDSWGGIVLCCGCILCPAGRRASALVSTQGTPTAPLPAAATQAVSGCRSQPPAGGDAARPPPPPTMLASASTHSSCSIFKSLPAPEAIAAGDGVLKASAPLLGQSLIATKR